MPALQVIDGCCDGRKRGALAFVHPLRRLDLSTHAILSIEALDAHTFVVNRTIVNVPRPHVALELDRRAGAALYAMTSAIMASDLHETPMAVWVGGECVSQPVLREPIGLLPSFSISAFTIEEARLLAQQLRSKGIRPPLAAVTGG